MRPLSSYDYSSIARNLCGAVARWGHRRRLEVSRVLWWTLRVPLGMMLFWITAIGCMASLAAAVGFYALGKLVAPKEYKSQADYLA